jgi:hypothetical protein
MAMWKILDEPTDGGKPGEAWTDSGTTYDDANGPIADQLAALQASDGRCRAAEAAP